MDFIQFFCINCCTIYSLYKIFTKDKNIIFLLLACEELLKFAPIIIQFQPSPVPKLNSSCLSNPIPYPLYLYLSISAFLVKLTAPNKQFSNVG